MGSKIMSVVPLLLAGACASSPTPVAVAGAAPDVLELAGEWAGEYWSLDSGRSGSILFQLRAGADSALGDVLMIAPGQGHDHAGGRHPSSEYIAISFVRVAGTRVRGALEPYRDPSCDCQAVTTFEGNLQGDRIEGTFTTRHVRSDAVQEGRWRVQRTPSADKAAATRPPA